MTDVQNSKHLYEVPVPGEPNIDVFYARKDGVPVISLEQGFTDIDNLVNVITIPLEGLDYLIEDLQNVRSYYSGSKPTHPGGRQSQLGTQLQGRKQ